MLYSPPQRPSSDLAVRLGLVRNGMLPVDAKTAQTPHPNIYVAGDLAGLFTPQTMAGAAYSGVFVARHVHQALSVDDLR